MQAFVDSGFRNTDSKSLNFVRKSIQAVTLADIVTADRNRISHQLYHTVESNSLRKEIQWPKVPTVDKMSPSFITLWKSILNKCFIIQSSTIAQQIPTCLCLGN